MSKIRNLIIRHTILDCTFTPQQWNLYTSSMDCDKVARAINRHLKKTVKKHDNYNDALNEMHGILTTYSKYGAADSESLHFLEKVLDAIYGN